jgi:hypothetical protein
MKMRIVRKLPPASVLGALFAAGGLAPISFASPTYPFTTVLNQGDAIGGIDPSVDNFGGAVQIAVANDGSIGIIGQLQNSLNPIVILSQKFGSAFSSQSVIQGFTDTSVSGLSGPQNFSQFENLAISGGSVGPADLTFTVLNTAAPNAAGLLQYTEGTTNGSGNPNVRNIAFNGQGYYFGQNTSTPGGTFGPIEYQVNQNGDVLFLASPNSNTTSSAPNVVLSHNNSNNTVFTSTGSLEVSTATGNNRIAIAPDTSGAVVLDSSGTNGVYNTPTGSTPHSLTAGQTLIPGQANVLGYNNISGSNTALVLVAGSNSSQNVILASPGGSQTLLNFTPPSSNANQLNGEISPTGKIALYVPGTNSPAGDVIDYFPGAPVANPANVHVGEPVADGSSSGLIIQSLQNASNDYVPMVNNNGLVVFDAEIGTSPSDEMQALLSWIPGQTPTVLLAAGDQLPIGNDTDPSNLPIIADLQTNNAGFDSDYTRNTLNDSGEVAVGVDYYFASDPLTTYAAVLATQIPTSVPEPTALPLLSIAAARLLKRKRTLR